MRESVTYQEILQDGEQKGRLEESVTLILRQLTRRFDTIDETTRSKIAPSLLPLLDNLSEDLLDFLPHSQIWLTGCKGISLN